MLPQKVPGLVGNAAMVTRLPPTLRCLVSLSFALLLGSIPGPCSSGIYAYDERTTIIGEEGEYVTARDESLIEAARRLNVGYNAIVAANPHLDPFVPGGGSRVRTPTSWALPASFRQAGLLINLSEFRLYCLDLPSKGRVVTFPIGIGDDGFPTPTGRFRVVRKAERPSWHVPRSIRAEQPELPPVVPPGPDNPLGSHALWLSGYSILIHGTNRPYAIGRKASHGCIRMYPEDIPILFRLVRSGTDVAIVRQPVKIGLRRGRVFCEAHPDHSSRAEYRAEASRIIARASVAPLVSWEALERALARRSGIPEDISRN